MKVAEVMTRDVRLASPNQSICDAAKTMADTDSGALPVSENDRLVGVITDRDITVRSVAEGHDPKSDRVKGILGEMLKWVVRG